MVYWLWCAWAVLISALAEITLGQYGMPVPVLVTVAFYFAVLGPWYQCGLPLMLGAALIDGLLPYSLPACGVTMLVLMPAAAAWRGLGFRGSMALTALPGCLMGVLYGLLRIMAAGFPAAAERWLLMMAMSGAVLAPLAFILLETVGRLLAVRRLVRIGMNYAEDYYLGEREADDE